jgi:hypothetical protein
LQTVGRLVAAAVMAAALLVSGCSHKSASEITGTFAPFLRTRDLAVENAVLGKEYFDTASIGQLSICYSDLRSKAGQYSDFIAGVIRTASFDGSQNQRDEHDLEVSIASYNDCTLKVQKAAVVKSPPPSLSLLGAEWVPGFGQSVESYWARDGALVQSLSTDAKAQLIDEITTTTAWPDFATIGAGTPAPTP